MEVSTAQIKVLREESGAGIMECRNALAETGGDKAKALEILQKQGLIKAKKSEGRVAKQGLVEAYIHAAGRIGALVEVNCETDFVARTEEFKKLAHEIAMQVAAMSPEFISRDCVAESANIEFEKVCLMLQPYIKDPTKTVQDIISEVIAKTGENIKVSRFSRFQLGGE